ncbi:AMIN-like domain-containing (lipo)protein [Streptomyces sp. NPDC054961]
MIRPRRRRATALGTGALLAAALGCVTPAPAAAATAASASSTATAPSTALVVDARWGGHCTYDRVVVDLRGHVPAVTVTPVSALVHDGSGKPVPLAGRYFLEIRLSPAAGHDGAGRNVYRGPGLVRIGLPALKGLALTGDFEGHVTLGAAFDTRPDVTSFTLHRPERFVLDVAHPDVC